MRRLEQVDAHTKADHGLTGHKGHKQSQGCHRGSEAERGKVRTPHRLKRSGAYSSHARLDTAFRIFGTQNCPESATRNLILKFEILGLEPNFKTWGFKPETQTRLSS